MSLEQNQNRNEGGVKLFYIGFEPILCYWLVLGKGLSPRFMVLFSLYKIMLEILLMRNNHAFGV